MFVPLRTSLLLTFLYEQPWFLRVVVFVTITVVVVPLARHPCRAFSCQFRSYIFRNIANTIGINSAMNSCISIAISALHTCTEWSNLNKFNFNKLLTLLKNPYPLPISYFLRRSFILTLNTFHNIDVNNVNKSCINAFAFSF